MNEKLIKIAKAAELLAVSVSTLRNWDNSGKLKARRTLGGHRRYTLEQIQKAQDNFRKTEKSQ